MEQLAHPIRQFLSFGAVFKNKDTDGPVVRMSDINHSFTDAQSAAESFDLSENLNKMAKLSDSLISDCEILELDESMEETNHPQVLNEELNDLDFKKFVDDLAENVVETNDLHETKNDPPLRSRIIYERTARKETIIIDSMPNRNSNEVKVVKVKITLPRDRNNKMAHPIANCTSTFKKSTIAAIRAARSPSKNHHLPIMGKAALMNKIKNGNKNNDSEIIKDLVTQRFQDFLINYYEKSFYRQSARLMRDDSKSDLELDQQYVPACSTLNEDLHGLSSIASVSMTSSESTFYGPTAPVTRTVSRCSEQTPSTNSCIDNTWDSRKSHETVQDSYNVQNICGFANDMKFLMSTDDHNVETTNENNINYSTMFKNQRNLNESEVNADNKLDESLAEYDAAQFLKDALGDELHNCYSTDVSYINNSIGTSNISALISKASTQGHFSYNSTIYEDTWRSAEYDYYPYNKRVNELLIQSDVQYQIITQTSKALTFCKSTKEFNASAEELEAERILLIATCKREAIRDEIRRLEYEDVNYSATKCYGCIKITKIVLPPKQRNLMFTKVFDKKKKNKEFTDWFLCVLTYGADVFATKAVTPDNDGFIRFQDEIVFDNLNADFEIQITFYSMKIRNPLRSMSHESKFHLNNERTRMCPLSPPKLFNSKNTKQYKTITLPTDLCQQSSYMLSGQFTLRINNIGHLGHFKLSYLTLPSLEGNFIMDFASSVCINEDYSGFLNIGLENYIGDTLTWNRRWCTLNGPLLTYYNYPGEENPLGFIDLHYCATATISSADRQICARPRTLLVEIFSNIDDTCKPNNVLKYFLAADSRQYMEMWENKLNSTISALRTWNVMKCSSTLKRN